MFGESYTVISDSEISMQLGGTKKLCESNFVEFHDFGKVYSYEFIEDSLLLNYSGETAAGEIDGVFKLKRL